MEWANGYKREQRASWEDIAQMIHDAVTIEEALSFYCPTTPRNRNRCPCPIHNGKDFNFSYTKHGYKCFVCGASGDVVALVKEVCELSTRAEAMTKLNYDFRLGLPIGTNITPQISAEIAKRRAEADAKQKEHEAWLSRYHELLDLYIKYDKAKREKEPMSEEYAEAVKNLPVIGYKIDSLPTEPR